MRFCCIHVVCVCARSTTFRAFPSFSPPMQRGTTTASSAAVFRRLTQDALRLLWFVLPEGHALWLVLTGSLSGLPRGQCESEYVQPHRIQSECTVLCCWQCCGGSATFAEMLSCFSCRTSQATYMGDLRNLLVMFVCNISATTPFMIAQGEKQPLNYGITVVTACACPNGCSGQGGHTSCLFIDQTTNAVSCPFDGIS
jgi:hypothetical protein